MKPPLPMTKGTSQPDDDLAFPDWRPPEVRRLAYPPFFPFSVEACVASPSPGASCGGRFCRSSTCFLLSNPLALRFSRIPGLPPFGGHRSSRAVYRLRLPQPMGEGAPIAGPPAPPPSRQPSARPHRDAGGLPRVPQRASKPASPKELAKHTAVLGGDPVPWSKLESRLCLAFSISRRAPAGVAAPVISLLSTLTCCHHDHDVL